MLKALPDQSKTRSLESHPAVLSFSRKREFSLQSSAKEVKPMKSLAPVRALGQRVTTTRAPTLARP
jgi:hypothetical protein